MSTLYHKEQKAPAGRNVSGQTLFFINAFQAGSETEYERMKKKEFAEALADAGCAQELAEEISALYAGGDEGEALNRLRCCRCEQLGAVHEEQRKIDLYDYLIGQIRQQAGSARRTANKEAICTKDG